MKWSNGVAIFVATIVSGICWYFSFELSGGYGWLLWIAPVPVLVVSLRLSPGKAFAICFFSYLIGRLSWLGYLSSVLPMAAAILATVLFPVIFALIVLVSRKVILKTNHWISIFAFPTCFVAFEYLAFLLSRDGTFGSLAYTQLNYLPVIQIASITGLTGITFLLCLIPSAIAVGIHYWNNQKIRNPSFIITICVLILSITFGVVRLGKKDPGRELTAGLTIIDQKFHFQGDAKNTANTKSIIERYEPRIAELGKQGAQIIVLPEKIITITNVNADTLIAIWKEIARKNHVHIVLGYTRNNETSKTNNAMVISATGEILSDYKKVNLFEGEVYEGFRQGKDIALFELESLPSGVVICKDMDFQQYLRKYGGRAKILYVPAWDFRKDDWLHSRMAILRGVENGYAIIRNAMEGRLTITDSRGRVLHEASSSNGLAASLVGKVTVEETNTIYSRAGDWFSICCTLAALGFIGFLTYRKIVDR